MNNDYSLQDLSRLLVQIGKKKHGSDYAYAWAVGTICGMMDFNIKYRPNDIQRAINEKYAEAEKELAVA